MIRKVFSKQPRGQSLVFVAVLSVALIGMLALALDFGYSMYNRRWAQNAADSAALGAARILCIDRTLNRYTNAANEARSYAEIYNQVFGAISQTMTEICMYGNANNPAGCPTLNKGEARVVVNIQHPTFVSGFFGTNSIDVPATATAGCFAPGGAVGAGVIPIAWKCDNISCNQLGECTCGGLDYIPTQGSCVRGVDPIYVFFDQDPGDSYYWCTQWGAKPLVNGLPDPAALEITCDIPNTARTVDIIPVSPINPNHKWFWFDNDGGACSSNVLVDVIRNGLNIPMYTHTWYPECTGDRGTAYDNLDDYRDNSRVILPVFDRQCQIADPLTNNTANCFAGPSNGLTPSEDTATDIKAGPAGNSQSNWYHLASFTLLDIKCVEDPNSQCRDPYARQWLEDNNPSGQGNQSKIGNENSFEGCFVEGFVPGMFGRPADGIDTGAWTLYLVK